VGLRVASEDLLLGELVEATEVLVVSAVAGQHFMHLFGQPCAVGHPDLNPHQVSVLFQLLPINQGRILPDHSIELLLFQPVLKLRMYESERRREHMCDILQ